MLAAARSQACRGLAENTALLRPLVDRFVAGETVDAVLAVTAALTTDRLRDHRPPRRGHPRPGPGRRRASMPT